MSTQTVVVKTADESRTYGNWFASKSFGLGRLGTGGTVFLFVAVIVALAANLVVGWKGLLVAAFLTAVVLAPLAYRKPFHDEFGRNGWQLLTARIAWRRGVRRGEDLYLSALCQADLLGTVELPGLLSGARLHEFDTSTGVSVGMVEHSAVETYAVLLRLQPQGGTLVDQFTVDEWVRFYGEWLSTLATEPGLEAATVTIESTPDPGNRLAVEVDRLSQDGASELCRQMLRESAETFPAAAARVDGWATLIYNARRDEVADDDTFTATAEAQPKRDVLRTTAEMATLIASRLNGILANLSLTGAGGGVPMTGQDIAHLVRGAYDPDAAPTIDELVTAGKETGVRWESAGPVSHQQGWSKYRHDGAASIVWTMEVPPRTDVDSRILNDLLAPHKDVDRKRITMTYRLLDPASAANAVDAQDRTATSKANRRASSEVAQERTRAVAREQARGAGVTRFGMVITATVRDPENLPQAGETTAQLSAAAKLTVRRAYGWQAGAFAAGLGIGVLTSKHIAVPDAIRTYA